MNLEKAIGHRAHGEHGGKTVKGVNLVFLCALRVLRGKAGFFA